MDTKTALGAAGGITLTVVGAVSALALTLGGGTSMLDRTGDQPTPIIEVVDQYGNPVDLQQPAAAPEIVLTTDVSSADTAVMASAEPDTGYGEVGEMEDPEAYEEHEDEDHDEYPEDEDDD